MTIINIIILIKAVKSSLLSDEFAGNANFSINPYDMFALKHAVEFKSSNPDNRLTCLSMGPLDSKDILTRCIALGADKGILLNDNSFIGSDTFSTSYILSKAIERMDFDIIISGQMSVDGETGQVPICLAERLNIHCLLNVVDSKNTFDKVIAYYAEDNTQYKVSVKLPIMLQYNGFCKYISPTLLGLKRAKKKSIEIWDANFLNVDKSFCGASGSKTAVVKTSPILSSRNASIFLDNDIKEITKFILNEVNTIY